MKHLLIIGARGFGREVYNYALSSIGYGEVFDVKGYLDGKRDALDGYEGYPTILSSVEDYEVQPDDIFVCALGDVKWKKHYAQMILDKGGVFPPLIHREAKIASNVVIGEGCIICPDCRISCDVKVGKFTTIQPNVFVGHDAKIGEWSHINTFAAINGFVSVGDFVTIHTSAIVVPKVSVGDNATIGAGSVAVNNVDANATVFGNPARAIFRRE